MHEGGRVLVSNHPCRFRKFAEKTFDFYLEGRDRGLLGKGNGMSRDLLTLGKPQKKVHGWKWKFESSSGLGFGMRFLVMTPKVQATKEKID